MSNVGRIKQNRVQSVLFYAYPVLFIAKKHLAFIGPCLYNNIVQEIIQ